MRRPRALFPWQRASRFTKEENYPEYWVFAQKGEEAMKTLIPGGAEAPPGGKVDLDQSRWRPQGPRSNGEPTSAEIYFDQLNFAQEEERRRRAGKVLVKAKDLKFQLTPMDGLPTASMQS